MELRKVKELRVMAWKWQSLDLIHVGVPRSKHRILKRSKRTYSANDNLEKHLGEGVGLCCAGYSLFPSPLPRIPCPPFSTLPRADPPDFIQASSFLWALVAAWAQPMRGSSKRPGSGKRMDGAFLCLPSPCFHSGCVAMAKPSIMRFPPLSLLLQAPVNTKPSPHPFRPEVVMAPLCCSCLTLPSWFP